MDNEKTLKKVNDRLYIEPYKGEDGKESEVNWKKDLEPMWLDLTDVRLCHTFSRENPVFAIGRDKTRDKLPYDEYEKEEKRAIRAVGCLARYPNSFRTDTISLITANGSIDRNKHSRVKNVYIRRMEGDLTQDDVENRRANGSLGYYDGEVFLDIAIPSDVFDSAYRQLQEPKGKEVAVCVYVDTFNTDMERAFRPPDMARNFYFEADSHSPVYFKTLMVSELAQTIVEETASDEPIEGKPNRVRWSAQGWYKWAQFFVRAGSWLIFISFATVVIDWWNGKSQVGWMLGVLGIGCILIAILQRLEAVLEEMTRQD